MKALLFGIITTVALSVGVFSVQAKGYDSAQNRPSYWGDSCYKIEKGLGETYTAPQGATKVVIKGGTDNAVYTSGTFTNLTAPVNPNNDKPYGISHVIVCTDVQVAPASNNTDKPVISAGKGDVSDDSIDTITLAATYAAGLGEVTELPATGASAGMLIAGLISGFATYLVVLKIRA